MLASLRRSPYRISDSEDGLSLIELMIAIFILSVAILGLAGVAAQSLTSLRISRDREQATDHGSAAIESVRLEAFEEIALATSDTDLAANPDVSGGCLTTNDEPVVTTPFTSDIQHVTTAGPNGRFRVEVMVTWADDDGDAPTDDSCATTPATHPRDTKRVTARVTWNDQGRALQVVQSTLVGEAERGLPLPDFTLAPSTGALSWTPAEATAGTTKCLAHLLRNFGAEDAYDYELTAITGIVGFFPPDEFRGQGGKWRAQAFFEHPLATPVGLTPPVGAELMTDADGDTFPESTKRVPTGESGRIWVCYTANSSNIPGPGDSVQIQVEVRSRFDPNESEVAEHTLGVGVAPTALYFQSLNDNASHTRQEISGVAPLSGALRGVKEMSPLSPPGVVLGGTNGLLKDWDTNFDSSQTVPGAELADGNVRRDLVFDEQFTAAGGAVLGRNASIKFWSAPQAHALCGTGGPCAASLSDVDLTYTIRVEQIASNEKNRDATLWTGTVSYTHLSSQANFVELAVPIDFGAPVVFAQNKYIRVVIHCNNISDEDCHVAYDAELYPSRLEVVLQ